MNVRSASAWPGRMCGCGDIAPEPRATGSRRSCAPAGRVRAGAGGPVLRAAPGRAGVSARSCWSAARPMDERDRAVDLVFRRRRAGSRYQHSVRRRRRWGIFGRQADDPNRRRPLRAGAAAPARPRRAGRDHDPGASAHRHRHSERGIVVSMRRRIDRAGGHCAASRTPVLGPGLPQRAVWPPCARPRARCPAVSAVLAIGHSARDTFEQLFAQGLPMQAKPFSVGVRIEHRQETIDLGLYGRYAGTPGLPPGEYFLSRRVGDRGCYSFCMCPGGTVVAASSEEGMVVTNGMSVHARDGVNANAALAVSVTPDDFADEGPLAGVAFQRMLERSAFAAGGGDYSAPVQCVGDFLRRQRGRRPGRVQPTYPRGWNLTDLNEILPPFAAAMLRESIPVFGKNCPDLTRTTLF